MAFSAKDVQALREKTGVGMMDCKKALTEADGDMEKAIDLLREKGLAAAAKKSGRIAAEGLVYATYCSDCKTAVAVEVNSETDFVAKNASFQEFVEYVAKVIMKQNPADVDALLALVPEGEERTVAELLNDKILTIGENLKIRRFTRMEGVCSAYVHGGGRIGVLVKFDTSDDIAAKDEFKVAAKDVAMQIAAVYPQYLDKESVPSEVVDKEKNILKEQVMNEGKPENIAEKIVMGKLGKFYKEVCLMEQPFVKDSDMSVAQYVKSIADKLGGEIKVVDFVRFEKGEGIQKREDNFADEIASMVKK